MSYLNSAYQNNPETCAPFKRQTIVGLCNSVRMIANMIRMIASMIRMIANMIRMIASILC